jgi:hypothetical protein
MLVLVGGKNGADLFRRGREISYFAGFFVRRKKLTIIQQSFQNTHITYEYSIYLHVFIYTLVFYSF